MDNIRNFRILFPSADNTLPDGDFAGYVGEHNATLLEITPPKEMTDCEDIVTYRIAFELTNNRAVHSDPITKAASISMFLPSQITSSKVIAVQLEGYSADNNLVAKSAKMVKIKFHPSVCGTETGANNEPFGIVTEVTANTKARHSHKNAGVLDGLSDSGGTLQYKGKPISGVTVDSAFSGSSTNPVQNKVVKAKFDAVDKNISDNLNGILNNASSIADLSKKVPDNTDVLNNFSYGGTLLYNGRPIGEVPTKTIELSINDDGFALDIDSAKNCVLYQYQGVEREIPVGTKIETVQFYIDDKWIDIHAMAELDRVAYSLNLHKIFPYDDVGGNVFCLWNPTNVISNRLSSYFIDRIRITYVMPRISFYVDGNLRHVEYAELNGTVQLPDEPEKDGYTFTGWSVESSEDLVEFPYTAGGEDITFVANFRATPYTATFYADGAITDTVNHIAGESISPDIPTKTGYEFIGWEPELPDTMPAENTSYSAKWQAKTFDAVFKVDGEVYKRVPTVFGEKIAIPSAPSKTGYTFVNWTPVPGRMDREGKTFEATWKVNQVNVYFMDDTAVLQKITVNYNSQVNAIADPTKQYYTFSGWKVSGNTANFPITVGEDDVYIRAEWIRNTIKIYFRKTFENEYYGYIDSRVYNCGDPLIPPEYPVEDGYVFVGWGDACMVNTNQLFEFDDAFFDEYRPPAIVPDSNEVGDFIEYYPLYFKGGYIEAEEGYNDTANVWGYQEYQDRYNIFVGGSGSLERNMVAWRPWYDIEKDNIMYGMWTIFGHGITEIMDVPYATFYVYLPSTIKKIHPNAFASGVSAVYYEGTEEQWAEIEIGENNPNFENMTIYFNQPKITI